MANDPNSMDYDGCLHGNKGEKESSSDKKDDIAIISEELVIWMTEGTPSNRIPRSDCG